MFQALGELGDTATAYQTLDSAAQKAIGTDRLPVAGRMIERLRAEPGWQDSEIICVVRCLLSAREADQLRPAWEVFCLKFPGSIQGLHTVSIDAIGFRRAYILLADDLTAERVETLLETCMTWPGSDQISRSDFERLMRALHPAPSPGPSIPEPRPADPEPEPAAKPVVPPVQPLADEALGRAQRAEIDLVNGKKAFGVRPATLRARKLNGGSGRWGTGLR